MLGLFDSGLGGLTVLKEIKKKLPQYDYLYLGDTLHVPYGNRSDEAVYELSKKACDFLFEKGCKLIIVACNTATAKALRKLQQEYLPEKRQEMKNELLNVLGVVRPVAEYFAQNEVKTVGVIGTKGTINSKVYLTEINKVNSEIKIFQKATPLLVPLIEENWIKVDVTKKILRTYLNVLKLRKVNSLILGCTHYPLLLKQIKQVMGKKCLVPNPAEIVADSLKDYLTRHGEFDERDEKTSGTSRQEKVKGEVTYFVTDLNENFANVAHLFLQEKIKLNKIVL